MTPNPLNEPESESDKELGKDWPEKREAARIAELEAEIQRLKEWNGERAGKCACLENRLGRMIAKLQEKYRIAFNGLETIVSTRCNPATVASAAMKRCVDVGDTSDTAP